MRDRRFVAAHRGGPLDRKNHAALAAWAADCAERVLPFFERRSKDKRPALAIRLLRAWAAGEVATGVAMKASLGAHAAARNATDPASIAAGRAVGQAAGTAHCADHCMGALLYALKVFAMEEQRIEREAKKQIAKLPRHLRDQVSEGVVARLGKFKVSPKPAARSARGPSGKSLD